MSRKHVVQPYLMARADLGADIIPAVSKYLKCSQLDRVQFNVEWSGGTAPVGEIEVFGMFDDSSTPDQLDILLTDGSAPVVNAVSGQMTLIITATPYKYMWAQYAYTSGSGGTMSIKASGKSEAA